MKLFFVLQSRYKHLEQEDEIYHLQNSLGPKLFSSHYLELTLITILKLESPPLPIQNAKCTVAFDLCTK